MNQFESVLPQGFSGLFYFTNFSDRDFEAKWNNVKYLFPANKSTPMVISDATPLEIQNIRKKFARELAEREILNTDTIAKLNAMNPQHTINNMNAIVTYNTKDLEPLIQRCLEPLPIAEARSAPAIKDEEIIEKKLRRDNRGRKVSRILEKDESLLANEGVLEN